MSCFRNFFVSILFHVSTASRTCLVVARTTQILAEKRTAPGMQVLPILLLYWDERLTPDVTSRESTSIYQDEGVSAGPVDISGTHFGIGRSLNRPSPKKNSICPITTRACVRRERSFSTDTALFTLSTTYCTSGESDMLIDALDNDSSVHVHTTMPSYMMLTYD